MYDVRVFFLFNARILLGLFNWPKTIYTKNATEGI